MELCLTQMNPQYNRQARQNAAGNFVTEFAADDCDLAAPSKRQCGIYTQETRA